MHRLTSYKRRPQGILNCQCIQYTVRWSMTRTETNFAMHRARMLIVCGLHLKQNGWRHIAWQI